MIRAVFQYAGDVARGFSVSGHAGFGVQGTDIVCAAVSSAAYMTANTLTEICGLPADITVDEGHMSLSIAENQMTATATAVLDGFFLHLKQMQEQYPERIQVQKMEV